MVNHHWRFKRRFGNSWQKRLYRWARVQIMGGVMGGMTKHQRRTISDLAEVG